MNEALNRLGVAALTSRRSSSRTWPVATCCGSLNRVRRFGLVVALAGGLLPLAPDGGTRRIAAGMVTGLDGDDSAVAAEVAGERSWVGLGGDENWSTAANWSPEGVPGNGDSLIFPDVALQKDNHNDLANGRFDNVVFTGSGYTITGNPIAVDWSVVGSNTAGANTLGLPIEVSGPTTFWQAAGGTYVVDGAVTIAVASSLMLTGAGAQTINTDTLVGGPVIVDKFENGVGGTVNLHGQSGLTELRIDDGSVQLLGEVAAPVVVNGQRQRSSSLTGEGQIGGLTAGGTFGWTSYGIVSPTDGPDAGAGAVLTVNGALKMAYTTLLNLRLNSGVPVPEAANDQIVVNGTVELGGGLFVPATSTTPPIGEEIIVIANDGQDPVVGWFRDLYEGDTLWIGGVFPARISYAGGDGNDVTLYLPPTFLWDGGAGSADTNWGTAQNWDPDGAPLGNQTPYESLVFLDAIDPVANNDLAPGRVFDDIQVYGSGMTLRGNAIELDRRIVAANDTGVTTFDIPTSFVGDDGEIRQISTGTFDLDGTAIDVNGGSLTLSGSGTFTGLNGVDGGDLVVGNLYSFATVTISGGQSLPRLDGSIIVRFGILVLDGELAVAGVIVDGGTLTGTGVARGLDVISGVVSPGRAPGVTAPGPGPGIMTIAGNLDVGDSARMWMELSGPTAGAQHDRLDVAGTVSLGGTLQGTTSAALTNGTVVTIIENDGSDAVTGTFSGQPNNSTVMLGGRPFTIRYDGGDGNDVVLTAGPHVMFDTAAQQQPENTAVDLPLDVVMEGVQAADVTVHVEITGGTGTAGTDVTALDRDLTFPAGQMRVRVPLSVLDDRDPEPDETIVVSLSVVTQGVRLGAPSTFTLTIRDDDSSVITEPPTTVPPATTTPTPTPLSGTLTVSDGTVVEGAAITVSAGGLCANTTVTFVAERGLVSTALDTRATDAAGSVTFTMNVTLPHGTYAIVARSEGVGCRSDARTTLVVISRAAPPRDLPPAGITAQVPLATATIMLLAGAALLVFTTRRRSARRSG